MLGAISRNVLTGLITLLPVVLTLYLLYWLVVSTESMLGSLLQMTLPAGAYRPGMGVVAGLVVTGAGRPRLWQPEEAFFRKRAASPPRSKRDGS